MRLSYVPIPSSHHVYLNGLEMQEGVDWSDDGTGLITCLGPMAEASGDLLECRYAHLGVVPPVVAGDFVAVTGDHGTFTGGSFTLITPAHTAGDLLLAILVTGGTSMTAAPAGWTLVGSETTLGRAYVFMKIGAGQATQTTDAGTFGGTTWYESTTMTWTNGLSTVSDLTWGGLVSATTSPWDVPTPGIAASGRILHYAFSSDANFGWTAPAGYTKRFSHNWGNSPTHAIADRVGDGSTMVWVGNTTGGVRAFNAITATMRLA